MDHPVAARRRSLLPMTRGTSTGRTSSGSVTSRIGEVARAMRWSAICWMLTPRARADVVDLARLAALGEQPVGAHDVAHVGEVAHRVERTDGDLLDAVALAARDPRGERGDHELLRLSRTGVTERSNPDRAEAVAEERLHREHVGRGLRRAVGRDGRSGVASVIGRSASGTWPYSSELSTTTTRATPRSADAREHVERAFGVDPERRGGRLPAVAHVAERGQVVHDVGIRVAEPLADVVGVGDLERIRTGAVERDDLVAAGLEVGDEVRADESECAGDDRLHAATPAAIR